jgi:hypothetical protein
MTDLVVRPWPVSELVPDELAANEGLIDELAADEDLADEALADQLAADEDLADEELTDEELTALALAADPDAPLPDDAVPFGGPAGKGIGLLPSWYMSPVVRSGRKRRYRIAVGAVVVAFVTIDLFGLCATYGPLVLA